LLAAVFLLSMVLQMSKPELGMDETHVDPTIILLYGSVVPQIECWKGTDCSSTLIVIAEVVEVRWG
jgi:hypothetical protein